MGSFQVTDKQANNELAVYIKNYFKDQKKKQSFRRNLLKVTKHTIKSLVAALSLWVPGLSAVTKGDKQVPTNYVYTNILDKLRGEVSVVHDPLKPKKTKLAEVVITPDLYTTGFIEDT